MSITAPIHDLMRPAHRDASLPDLVFVSMENWDEVWRRNQFLCAEFARTFPERKLLFVGLPIDVSNQLRHGHLATTGNADPLPLPEFPNIWVTRPVKWFPNSLPITRMLNEQAFRRHIVRACSRLGIESPILWLNPHSAGHLAGRMRESAVIYDITDDWTAITQPDRERQLIIRQDSDLCRRADAVIVCSQRLFDLKRPLTSRLHLVPNGVHLAHYASAENVAPHRLSEQWSGRYPVCGYTGTIHPDRVDLALIEAIANEFPQGAVVLVGPDHLTESCRRRLSKYSNIFTPGQIPYREIPAIMRSFDVSITPHRMSEFTESLNPIKLWEYLAMGLPIVATNVAGFRDFPDHVYLASDAAQFIRGIQAALLENPSKRPLRRCEASLHSWRHRFENVRSVLEAALQDRRNRS